ncbi:hypothetical protein MRX96_029379 [Rhipicephalus microplus]
MFVLHHVFPLPREVLIVSTRVAIEVHQVPGEVLRTTEVLDVDERVRRCQASVLLPGRAHDDRYDLLVVGVPPQLLGDVLATVAVLECQVKLVLLGDVAVTREMTRTHLSSTAAIHVYLDVLGQLPDVWPPQVGPATVAAQDGDQVGLGGRVVAKHVLVVFWQSDRATIRHGHVGVATVRHAQVEQAVVVAHVVLPGQQKRVQRGLVCEEDPELARPSPLVRKRVGSFGEM